MGPQNAHVLGLAKSFTKKIDHATKVEHDQDRRYNFPCLGTHGETHATGGHQ